MGQFAWIILAVGASFGGLLMIFGWRKNDARPEASGQIDGTLKEDWKRTGNIDFHASTDERSSLRPLRLWVEEKRITESAVGQNVVELRWRLATVEEGKELIVCWNNARQTSPYDVRRAWQISNERKNLGDERLTPHASPALTVSGPDFQEPGCAESQPR